MIEALAGGSISRSDVSLTGLARHRLLSWVSARYWRRVPLQYLIGSVPFLGLDLLCRPPVLIPRPETEQWTSWLASLLSKRGSDRRLRILDLCSGSGCISLGLASTVPNLDVIGVDLSEAAVCLAIRNAGRTGFSKDSSSDHLSSLPDLWHPNSDFLNSLILAPRPPRQIPSWQGFDWSQLPAASSSSRVFFTQGDITAPTFDEPRQEFDMIVSNPPYIDPADLSSLDPEVRLWESHAALVCPANGLALIDRVFKIAPGLLRRRDITLPHVVLEFGSGQSHAVMELAMRNGFSKAVVFQDWYGVDRWCAAWL
eukprot:TRINITY_DN671_c0_g1_i1.p1 TRINITY_DN671_c0_g1~~TRINITY_DN671_c0_g1_i1.p1  ORF type:complete len:312 (-),score=25.14 TRINITY_DN671_c0_g1_i1:151-1086(-)